MVNFFFNRYDDYEKFELKKEIGLIKGFLPFNYWFFDKVPKGKFIFFPIHLNYDAQVCVRNPMYYDQEFLIKNISKACPPGYTLVVKAHPYNSGVLIKKTYKLCKKLKNVKIVNSSISSFDLIKKAEEINGYSLLDPRNKIFSDDRFHEILTKVFTSQIYLSS